MAKEILTIWYKRPSGNEEEVTLTPENCQKYGYLSGTINYNNVDIIVYYLEDETIDDYLEFEFDETNNVAITTIVASPLVKYEHVSPPCSKYDFNFADVDKEGSGRNELTGQMFREVIGRYCSLDLAWDLIPNSIEYNNWLRVLTNLPPFFYVKFLSPTGEILERKFYRTDISTSLYLFTDGYQIWNGLSTSFVQANIDEIVDTYEPTLLEEPFEGEKEKQTYVIVTLNGFTKTVQSNLLELYKKNGWIEL